MFPLLARKGLFVVKKETNRILCVPASMLARLLPIIVFGSGSLTLDDIKAMMGSLLQKRARVHVDSIIATALLW